MADVNEALLKPVGGSARFDKELNQGNHPIKEVLNLDDQKLSRLLELVNEKNNK